jgi:hypothetical protein
MNHVLWHEIAECFFAVLIELVHLLGVAPTLELNLSENLTWESRV